MQKRWSIITRGNIQSSCWTKRGKLLQQTTWIQLVQVEALIWAAHAHIFKIKCSLSTLLKLVFVLIKKNIQAMKTYHEYQSESKQAEAKLKYVQSQKPKYEKQKSKKKLKQYEKQVEKVS